MPVNLHIGCGPFRIKGWTNIDNTAYRAVDVVLDVTEGLPFEDVQFVFAEHFIEHLHYGAASKLFRDCRRIMRDDGVLRLSTPSLDWVWASHYRADLTHEEQLLGCFEINRAFRGWGHQFLYNFRTLAATLQDAGFANVERREYGKSPHPELTGLERHEKSPDLGSLSSILIVEAWGRGGGTPPDLPQPRKDYLRDIKLK